MPPISADRERSIEYFAPSGSIHSMSCDTLHDVVFLDRLRHLEALPDRNTGEGRGPSEKQVVQIPSANDHAECASRTGGREVGLCRDALAIAIPYAPKPVGPLMGQDVWQNTELSQNPYALGHDPFAAGFVAREDCVIQ
jgi:hypothetical protein